MPKDAVTEFPPTPSLFFVDSCAYSWARVAEAAWSLDYQATQFSSGLEALEQIHISPPSLILLEQNALELPGTRLCEMLQANPYTRSIPVILMGQSASAEDRDLAFAAGASGYWVKPLSQGEVFHCLRTQSLLHHLSYGSTPPPALGSGGARSQQVLLTSLQRRLQQQAQNLQAQNQLLLQEVTERKQIELALREEQEKSDLLLLNVLPAPIAKKLKRGESNPAQRFEEATILFADIVGFTNLASRLPPLTLVQLLSEIFSRFDRLAVQLGVEKIKTIGDAYMVAGGVPTAQPDHAQAIMEMAIAMNQEIRRFNRTSGKPLRLRMGINTGTVVAGVIGLHKFSYDLWGDAVNVASRMESHGLPGKIQVTEATYLRLRDRYVFERWGKIPIKGKGEMVTYLFVCRRGEEASLPQGSLIE